MGKKTGTKNGKLWSDRFLFVAIALGLIGAGLGIFLVITGGSGEISGSLQASETTVLVSDVQANEDDPRPIAQASQTVNDLLEAIVALEDINIKFGEDLLEAETTFRVYIATEVTPQEVDPVNESLRPAWKRIVTSTEFEDFVQVASKLTEDLKTASATMADIQLEAGDSSVVPVIDLLELHRAHAAAWERFADKFVLELDRWKESWLDNSPNAREYDLHLLTALHDENVQISATFTSFCRELRKIDEVVTLTSDQLGLIDRICDFG